MLEGVPIPVMLFASRDAKVLSGFSQGVAVEVVVFLLLLFGELWENEILCLRRLYCYIRLRRIPFLKVSSLAALRVSDQLGFLKKTVLIRGIDVELRHFNSLCFLPLLPFPISPKLAEFNQ